MGEGARSARVAQERANPELDALALDLRDLRTSQGVSYREIAARIIRRRESEGVPPAAAMVAHTTVSDVFRLGRSRINADLVAEIVRALGVGEAKAAAWRERGIRAQAADRRPVADSPPAPLGPPEVVAPGARYGSVRRSRAAVALLFVGALLLNASGEFVNPLIGDVFFLDMIGTAIAAILLGPWWAALVGVAFIAVELLKGDTGHALFAVTMITAGLLWGFGVHRWDLGRTLPRFLGLSAAVALATSLLAVPITVIYFGGAPGRGLDDMLAWGTQHDLDPWAVIGASNLAVSLVDKVVTGAIAFFAARVLAPLLHLNPDAAAPTPGHH